MSVALFIELAQRALGMALALAGPLLLVSLAVGFAVSVFQALTQINEATLSFVPKIAAICVTLALAGPWLLQIFLGYTAQLLIDLPRFAR